jgi:septum formation protein
MGIRRMRLVLASASPRRLDLLERIGVEPDAIAPADIDETPQRGELPAAYAIRMAQEKAAAIQSFHAGALILAADTVVAVGRRILPKTENEAEARKALSLLSGRRHRVYSAIALIDIEGVLRQRLSTSIITFKRFGAKEIDAYIFSEEWRGKAGSYAIQGRAEALVRQLSGSHSGVVGLPLFETRALLHAAGYTLG